MSHVPDLPRLDCHAHIAPDVTRPQVAGLGGAFIFAMTRSPAEARVAVRRADETIVWGYGAHPGLKTSPALVTAEGIRAAVQQHVLIGEVGLDRSAPLGPQQTALATILEACRGKPVMLSLHSTGRTAELVELLEQTPHPGVILHWFTGAPSEVDRATETGCFFSVNAAMTDDQLKLIPANRMLPETDFPSSRRSIKAKIPGDIDYLETRLMSLIGVPQSEVRLMWYRNLADLAQRSKALERLPSALQRTMDIVP
ncbi:TatD family hydrolase [Catellatospora sp. TT07R-123]|uniref:TatD family hydrolase n=1 Tax=Catellatospora sp. TT07R-123 TaxID=2733863 RepID=UPI001B1CBFF8|nr:TatD family hydrolase [Catellatospora sp. TT07R-123]GHJ50606.1 TatD family hydrolase [Catellatospora sp. TT07R-123]